MTDDIFQYIDVERTIAEFGYDPREFTKGIKKLVFCFCIHCKEDKGVRKFADSVRSKYCRPCSSSKSKNRNFESNKIEKNIVSHNIDIERTILDFSHDPRTFSRYSSRNVWWNCLDCKKSTVKKFYRAMETVRCSSCFAKLPKTEEHKQKIGKSHKGKVLSEEHKNKISKNKTGIKYSAEVVELRASKVRGRKHTPEAIERMSGKNSHMFGKKAHHGRGAWYIKLDGSKIWMRSTWEIKYAKYLDENNIHWELEKMAFPVTYEYKGERKEGTYRPDFYINGEWFEVKGFWRDDAKPKFEAFKEQYPDEKITLLMKPELLALGIKVR